MNMQSEPARIIAWVVGVLTLLVNGVVVFGFDLSADQLAWVTAVIGLAAPLIAGYLIRSKVFAPDTVEYIASGSPTAERRLDQVS